MSQPPNPPSYPIMHPDDRSPCVKICQLSEDLSWCIGCGRTRVDIAKWLEYSRPERVQAKSAATERLRGHKLQNG